MLNKKVVLLGTHIAGLNSVCKMISSIEGIDISYIVTLTKDDAIRLNISGFADFTSFAKEHNIPIRYVKDYSLKEESEKEFFKQEQFDLLITAGWQRLIPQDILITLKIGAIGGHGSSDFLPRGRGRSPLNWSLIENKKRFISHLLLLKPGVDDGDIIDYEQFDINEFDDINTLYYKAAIVRERMLLRNIPKILNNELFTIKQKGQPSYYPKRTPQDGKIDFSNMDIDQIYNFIRALTKPYPCAFSYIEDKKIYFYQAQIFDRKITYIDAKYGEIVEIFDNNLIINCLGGLLLVKDFSVDVELKRGIIIS